MKLFTKAFAAFFIFTFSFFTSLIAQTPVFYGMTQQGGTSNNGAIIRFNPTTGVDSVVWNLGSGTDGVNPSGSLIYDTATGLFYGMTFKGGTNNLGTIISLNPSTHKDAVLYSMGNFPDAAQPLGSLVYDHSDKLMYGMTTAGGSNGNGGVISYNPANNIETVAASFNGTDGNDASGNLTYYAANGYYYGMSSFGGGGSNGSIFKFSPVTNAVTLLYGFANGGDGHAPGGSLVYDAAKGLFYGTTTSGGSVGFGAIISFNPTNNTESVVWSFGSSSDGSNPQASLVYDASNGLFYGTTYFGGASGYGTIFSFDPNTNIENVVYNMTIVPDGSYPISDLVYDAKNSLFYGVTTKGGTHNKGAIITFDPATNNESVVWSFGSGSDGAIPEGTLLLFTPNPTAINNLNNVSASIDVYPNPSNGVFTFEIKNEELKINNTIEVYNMMGEKVYSSQVLIPNSQFLINLSNDADGIYILRIIDENGMLFSQQKIMKVSSVR